MADELREQMAALKLMDTDTLLALRDALLDRCGPNSYRHVKAWPTPAARWELDESTSADELRHVMATLSEMGTASLNALRDTCEKSPGPYPFRGLHAWLASAARWELDRLYGGLPFALPPPRKVIDPVDAAACRGYLLAMATCYELDSSEHAAKMAALLRAVLDLIPPGGPR